jgi:NAD(P)-dependent dehydrogenase (short-subunit alcohol dehydrogenase family)
MNNPAHPQTHETAEFSGQRALVTGGTKGIGAAIVKRLASAGAVVLTTARSLPTGATPDHFIQADVDTRKGVNRVTEATLDRLGGRVRHQWRNDPDSLKSDFSADS